MRDMQTAPQNTQDQVLRLPSGRFRQGQSGNPGGRPRVLADVQELTRSFTQPALAALVEIATNPKAPAAVRVAAANGILDRGWGRACPSVTLTEVHTPDAEEVRRAISSALAASMPSMLSQLQQVSAPSVTA